MKKHRKNDCIVFACAGCSHAGQVAYKLALAIDQKGLAEMSCLAGVAAEKPTFLRKIKNKNVIAVDGCPIECSKGVFDRLGIPVHQHIRLKELGVKKNQPREEDKDFERMMSAL